MTDRRRLPTRVTDHARSIRHRRVRGPAPLAAVRFAGRLLRVPLAATCPAIRRLRVPLVVSVAALVLAGGAWPTVAQEPVVGVPVVEEQVALDTGGGLLRVDAELARRLGLFGDLTGLREVLLFRGPDGYVLELTRRRDGTLVRERRSLREADVEALRSEISRRLAERAPAALVDRSGRALLLGTSTVAGLGFYGWAVPYALDMDGTRGPLALYMLVSSASFFGPWLWSGERTVTLGMANGAFWGATRGALHGVGVHRLLAGDQPFLDCGPDDFDCFQRSDRERSRWERDRVAGALAGSLIEGIGALAWARAKDATGGDVHALGVASDLGALAAVGLGLVAGVDDGDARALWGLTLAGAAGGLVGGAAIRTRRDYSWGDVEVVRAATLLGGYTGATAADLLDSDEPRLFGALALGAGAAGSILGDRLVRDRDLEAGQGLLVDLGTVAGGLLGAGVAALLAAEPSADATPYLALSTLGAWSGFAITLAALPRRERSTPAVSPPPPGP